jgi:hypothetical protein
VFKKRWFDGLQDIYEGKDEFEIKFGCFGGDGGSSGGNTNSTQGEHDTTPSTGFRGEQSAASPSNKGYSGPTGVGIGPGTVGSTSGKSSTASSFGGDNDDPNQNISEAIKASIAAQQAVNNPMNMSINDIVTTNTNITNPQEAIDVALGRTQATSGKSLADSYAAAQSQISDMVANQMAQDQISQAQANLNDYMGNISNQGKFSNQPTQTGFSPFAPEDVSLDNLGFGLQYTGTFAKGGAVHQGIGSVFPYRRR